MQKKDTCIHTALGNYRNVKQDVDVRKSHICYLKSGKFPPQRGCLLKAKTLTKVVYGDFEYFAEM